MFTPTPENENKVALINRLASSESPFALRLLEEMVENEQDASTIAYAQQAIPSVKEHIFDAFKEARALEKSRLKKEFSKLESAAVQEHIDVLLELATYQHMTGQLYPAKKHFARAYALNPKIINQAEVRDLGYQLFAQETGDFDSEIEAYLKLQNKHDRVLEAKYPWYSYLFDFSVFGMWLSFIMACLFVYWDVLRQYPAYCRKIGYRYVVEPIVEGDFRLPNCADWDRAFDDNFARIAPQVPREYIAIGIIALLLITFVRIMMYIRQLHTADSGDWLEEARGNVFEDIEDELLKVFTPRRKKK